MRKRALSLILAMIVPVSLFCGCKNETPPTHQLVTQPTTQIVEDTKSFKLSYSQSDSLNPYESDTLNNQVVQDLVFEPLFRLDESFDAQPEIASSYAYENGSTLRVTIVSGLRFSDGSSLEAKEIVAAFYRAKESPRWKKSLAPIGSAVAESSTVIKFNLTYKNPYAHQLLTFGIAKMSAGKYPIGSGRYKFNEGDGHVFLELNPNYKEDFLPRFTQIMLVNVPASDSINNALNIGNISYAYRDLSTESISRLKCNKKKVNINNLVYVGIDSTRGITSNANIRQAISLAIDRSTIVKSAYQGYAKAATSIYHPASKVGTQTKMFSPQADIPAAKQAIAKSGYNDSQLKLTILVNQEDENKVAMAKTVMQQLNVAGFNTKVKSVSKKMFFEALTYHNYDIYIGETIIPADMRLSSFFSKSGATGYGIKQDSETAVLYNSYLSGNTELGKFILSFSNGRPFVPVVYRNGAICYSKSLHGDMQGYYGNYFFNIQDWYYN